MNEEIFDKFGVNLREFVAVLECQGKPEASGFLMMAMNIEDSKLLSLKGIRIDHESDTVWLMVEDY